MSTTKRLALIVASWVGVVTAAHFSLNLDWGSLLNERLPRDQRKFNVAYIPVT